jgi:serine protease inhibitor
MKMLLTLMSFMIIQLSTISCDNNNSLITPSEQLKNIPITFSDQTSEFAFNFWKKHHATESAEKNYFVSPLSLHIALGMLLNGANAQTKDEIQKSLGVSTDLATVNSVYKNLIDALPVADSKVTNTIANSVWYRNSFTVENDFLNTLKNNFKATASAEDFTNTATVGKINNWASENTNGKIKKVIETIESDQIMFLMNALYFKGDWQTPFDINKTTDSQFSNLLGKSSSVKMMNMTQKVKYAQRAGYHAIELPYGNGKNYVMTVLMPYASDTNLSVNPLLNTLSATEWGNLQASMKEQEVIVGLPKFSLEYETKLNSVLDKLGMPTMFTDKADLSKISPPAGKIKVGFVKQNTFLAIDEKGTEAAAVTNIGIVVTSIPNYTEFIVNRPFLFVISEKQSNSILFTGKIVNL